MRRLLFVVVGAAPAAHEKQCAGIRLYAHLLPKHRWQSSLSLLLGPCLFIQQCVELGSAPAEGEHADWRVPAHQNAEVFAGKLIGAGAAPRRLSVWLDGDWDQARFDGLGASVLGSRADVQAVVHVDLLRKAIWICAANEPTSAHVIVERGRVDVDALKVGYVPAIDKLLQDLKTAGFTVCPTEPSPLLATPS